MHYHSRLTAKVTGYNNFPSRYRRLLIEGGRANDTPGVTYTAIRGAWEMPWHLEKTKRRSIYGIKRPDEKITKLKKSLRMRGMKLMKDQNN